MMFSYQSLNAQCDTLALTGYLFVKEKYGSKPLTGIFIQKKITKDIHASDRHFYDQFDDSTDTGIVINMFFLCLRDSLDCSRVLRRSLNSGNSYSLYGSPLNNDDVLSSRDKMNVFAVTLLFIQPQVWFPALGLSEPSEFFISNQDGRTLIHSCIDQPVEWGIPAGIRFVNGDYKEIK